ncbi:MAG: ElyC/SanA/YdcF family protein [Pseudomonadota bacterium]
MRGQRLGWWGRTILLATAGAVAGAAVFAFCNFWVFHAARPHVFETLDGVPARDVAVVPGMGARRGHLGGQLLERMNAGLALYRAHKVKLILVSGIGDRPDRDEVRPMAEWFEDHGVPPTDILGDPVGYRTLDTMQRAARLFGVSRAIVCTQRLYVTRSVFLARQAGMDAVALITPPERHVSGLSMRREALKTVLAVFDSYLFGRRAKFSAPHGAWDGRPDRVASLPDAPTPVATVLASDERDDPEGQPSAAFTFLTSVINAGIADSHVATRP